VINPTYCAGLAVLTQSSLGWPNLAMKRVRIAELKDRLSSYLRAVEQGAEIEVTDRDRPIARIVPVGHPAHRVRIIPAARSFAEVRQRRYRRTKLPIDIVDVLLEDRRLR